MANVDPITFAVVRNYLLSAARGMQEVACRCAVTTIMYEIKDCCFGILDQDTGVIAQSHGLVAFLGSLGPATKNSLDIIGKENINPGDVILSNVPIITGSHSSDALLFTPIFFNKKIFGFAATKTHWQDVGACINEMYDYNERMARLAIDKIPDGTWTAEDYIDDNSIDLDKPLLTKVTVAIKGSDIIIDYTGSAPEQRGPVNGHLVGTISITRATIKALTTPNLPANEGCFRPIKVIAPKGCIYNMGPTAPVSLWFWVPNTCIWRYHGFEMLRL